MNYWLIKSEGTCYSIDDLKRDKKTSWSGVRNYQARNFMMKDMQIGDKVLFYHSGGDNNNPTGVYGLAKVASKSHIDETQFDKKSHYYEPRATKEKPMWECVKIKFVKKFKNPIKIAELRIDPQLSGMHMLQKGSRLSVTPVSEGEWGRIQELNV